MKVLQIYSSKEAHLRQLYADVQDYGKLNCNFEMFCQLYKEWHEKTFPGLPVNTRTARNGSSEWWEFLKFLQKKEI